MSAVRGRVLALALLGALGAVAAIASSAPAAESLRPALGTLDPRLMVLLSDDISGAKVPKQRYYRDVEFPSAMSYSREFEGGRSGRTPLLYLDSEAEVGTSAESTGEYVSSLRRVLRTARGRAHLAASFEESLPVAGVVSNVRVGRPRNLGVTPGSFDLPVTVRLLEARMEVHVSTFAVERVLGRLITIGVPGRRVPISVLARLAKTMATRMGGELAPRSMVPPTISGSAQAAQTLTVSAGTWAGAPATFSYQWQRCDPSGATCKDIPAACVPPTTTCVAPPTTTGPSYVARWLDAGSTIRVAVTATNSLGSATVVLAPTPVVIAAPASQRPYNTSPPTISGVLHVGETLTATTGSWTGNPTSFNFVWQRCDTTSTPTCLPTGGHDQSYVLGNADRGYLILVYVSAYNAAGGGSARSSKTSEVT